MLAKLMLLQLAPIDQCCERHYPDCKSGASMSRLKTCVLPLAWLQIVGKLKEEIGAMEKEHSELQQHITRTDWWCENLGHWRATITAAEVTSSLLCLFLLLLLLSPSVGRN